MKIECKNHSKSFRNLKMGETFIFYVADMRIQFKDFSQYLFGNLDPGDAFVFDGFLYIKTPEVWDANFVANAVRLDYGLFSFFDADTEIRPFNGKVVEE